jgi:sorting nexin-7/30/sorting nexin-8
MEPENDIQKKQSLLQSEIIDKNLDKTAFVNFCMSKRENGEDLNSWTYEELIEIVKEFTDSQAEGNEKNIIKKDGEQINKIDEDDKNLNVDKIEKFNAEENKTFKDFKVNCKKLTKTKLNEQEIKIIVNNYKEVEGGMFGKSYVKYEVHTEPLGYVVERRYSDFDMLRKLLQKYFPGYYIPPLPTKKMGNKRFTEKFIEKRMKFLNIFINNLVKIETFKASEILLSFLSYDDRGKFDSKYKEFQTQTPSSYVEEYKTLDGVITISLDEKNEKYFKNINNYFSLQENILDKVNYNLKMLNHNMNIICELIKVIQKNFEVLNALNNRVVMKPTITKTYEEIGCFFKNWGGVLTKQKELIKNHMKDFFKYVNLEGKAYSELIHRREELKTKYTNENVKLTTKKEKIFASQDINKFELNPEDRSIDREKILKDRVYAFEHMCYNDTNNLEKTHYQLGFANKMNMRELRKMIKEYCAKFVDNIAEFDKEFYPTINDLLGTYTNLETFVMTTKAGIK